ncbi:MAG TPA: DUF3349 domain-containing protein [Dermatophilaceae bacterium]|nr:DUF3349 domain-containing protein [Dermatophilaceae bacterium]
MASWLERVVAWLRAGYPNGVPEQDYVPLLALLRRRLSDQEIVDLGRVLVQDGLIPAERVDVGVGITKVIDDLPSEDELRRVRTRLHEEGWPVRRPSDEPDTRL